MSNLSSMSALRFMRSRAKTGDGAIITARCVSSGFPSRVLRAFVRGILMFMELIRVDVIWRLHASKRSEIKTGHGFRLYLARTVCTFFRPWCHHGIAGPHVERVHCSQAVRSPFASHSHAERRAASHLVQFRRSRARRPNLHEDSQPRDQAVSCLVLEASAASALQRH